jgi:hypothetical protein
MASGHLSCPACRIRLRADSPAIAVLEDRCPICGATLTTVASVSNVVGFRSFDLDALFERESDHQPDSPLDPADFVSRRAAACARDAHDDGRWSDDGGSTASEAVSQRPAPR